MAPCGHGDITEDGQLGIGNRNGQLNPVQVAVGKKFVAIAAGGLPQFGFVGRWHIVDMGIQQPWSAGDWKHKQPAEPSPSGSWKEICGNC